MPSTVEGGEDDLPGTAWVAAASAATTEAAEPAGPPRRGAARDVRPDGGLLLRAHLPVARARGGEGAQGGGCCTRPAAKSRRRRRRGEAQGGPRGRERR